MVDTANAVESTRQIWSKTV